MKKSEALRGLYVITDTALIPDAQFPERVEAALRGGARIVQYRDKRGDHALTDSPGANRGSPQGEPEGGRPRMVGIRERLAGEMVRLCREYGATSIINDDVELAARIGADGVHVGRDDAALEHARERLGQGAIIGVSCYNRIELALAGAEAGADYVAFGSFFASRVKPEAVPASPDLLREARKELSIPLCAIGGITADNAAPLVEAGADMLAVISDVFAAADVEAAARRYAPLFNSSLRA